MIKPGGNLRVRGADDVLEMAGDVEGLSWLANWLKQGQAGIVIIPPVDISPSPYERWFKRIRLVSVPDSPLRIGAADEDVTVAGSVVNMTILADNVLALLSESAAWGGHLHIEYYPGHFYLSEESIDVVIRVLD